MSSIANNREKFLNFRKDHPLFVYESFHYEIRGSAIHAGFTFSIPGLGVFHPEVVYPERSFYDLVRLDAEVLDNLVFHIGMIELISYWKVTCSPVIKITGYYLTREQEQWWKKLYYLGLGEFFYRNGIEPDPESFVRFEYDSTRATIPFSLDTQPSALIPVGGGKDSVVTLELLGAGTGNIPLLLNARKANRECVRVKGYAPEQCIGIQRTLDPLLLKLNDKGYLNGHTPFSALLAFDALLAAALSGRRYIALSNESSANEPTVEGSTVNHQYSKSVEFEEDFRSYVKKYITPDIEYFSFLRPLGEIQIARLFTRFPAYFPVFKSCNAGSKTDTWCGKCAKCLFTWIILSPFVADEELLKIFGKNMLEDATLIPLLDELTGRAAEKPFECIGTIGEVNVVLSMLVARALPGPLPVLLQHYESGREAGRSAGAGAWELLSRFDRHHYLPPRYLAILLYAHGSE